MAATVTNKQAQYLSFIYHYTQAHRCAPAETDLVKAMRVSPPSVHQMIVRLEQLGFLQRTPGQARSIKLLISPQEFLPNEAAPAVQPSTATKARKQRPRAAQADTQQGPRAYLLSVFLTDGPVPESFHGQVVRRDIEIRGDQTLADLYHAIFRAFDRFDEHLYEFQFGKGPRDRGGRRYGISSEFDEGDGQGDAEITTIDSLRLTEESDFGYWFDFGDDWYHQIRVESIQSAAPKAKYPRVTKRVGKSPPQYSDGDE